LDINGRMTSRTVDINCYDTTDYVDYKRSTRLAKDRKTELHKRLVPSIEIGGGAFADLKRYQYLVRLTAEMAYK